MKNLVIRNDAEKDIALNAVKKYVLTRDKHRVCNCNGPTGSSDPKRCGSCGGLNKFYLL